MINDTRKKSILLEVEEFKLEYPNFTDEHISEYLECCDDYTAEEKRFFASSLGY